MICLNIYHLSAATDLLNSISKAILYVDRDIGKVKFKSYFKGKRIELIK